HCARRGCRDRVSLGVIGRGAAWVLSDKAQDGLRLTLIARLNFGPTDRGWPCTRIPEPPAAGYGRGARWAFARKGRGILARVAASWQRVGCRRPRHARRSSAP